MQMPSLGQESETETYLSKLKNRTADASSVVPNFIESIVRRRRTLHTHTIPYRRFPFQTRNDKRGGRKKKSQHGLVHLITAPE